jgi:hypothetical protein
MVTPVASAEGSKQVAEEEVVYSHPDFRPESVAEIPAVVYHESIGDIPAKEPESPAVKTEPAAPAAPQPLWRKSKTTTEIGAHQDVAPMLKEVEGFISKMNKIHWLGLCAIVAGIGGILHSAGNKESGYPMVWVKVLAAGVLGVVMGDAAWFWTFIVLAGVLWGLQKFNLLRIPGVP